MKQTLLEIIAGVRDAQDEAESYGAQINPYRGSAGVTRDIEFDVEVSTAEGATTKGGLGVFVGPIGAGTQGQSEAKSHSVGRVRFNVAASLPTQPRKSQQQER